MTNDSRPIGFSPFPPGYRASGVPLHVTSLPSAYGTGDVGPAALRWIDLLHEAGQSWWQSLPLGPTGYGNSPYQSMSSFAGNGLLISLDWLIEDGLLRASDCTGRSFPETAVEYDAVVPFKHRLLDTAWTNFNAGARPDLLPAYEGFCHDHAHWLEDYALFRALKGRYNSAYYLEWPAELVRRVPAALAQARRDLASQIQAICFAQFLLFRQGARLRAYARTKGIRLIGDLPFFVSPDSSDVWVNPELFLLDEQHRPRLVAGVPPDSFSAQGQLWGNPVYNWDVLRRTGYRWCIDRLRALLAHVDVVRLDHFREWYEKLPAYQRENLWRYLKSPPAESRDVAWSLMRLAWSSVAALAIAPLQDLLNLGPEARMNVPGRAEGNWAWRCTEEMLSGPALHFLLELTTSSNRLCMLQSPLTSEVEEAAS